MGSYPTYIKYTRGTPNIYAWQVVPNILRVLLSISNPWSIYINSQDNNPSKISRCESLITFIRCYSAIDLQFYLPFTGIPG